MRIALSQINPTIGAFEKNTQKILSFLDRARKERADVVLFPELSLSGYPPEDLLLIPEFIDSLEPFFQKIIEATSGLLVFLGRPRKNFSEKEKSCFNSCAIIQNAKLIGYYDKRLLPTYDVFDEKRFFEPGAEVKLIHHLGKTIGITICEDIWQHSEVLDHTKYHKDPVSEMQGLGLDLLVNLSASPYHFGKPKLRLEVCQKAAKTLQCSVLLCCQVGCNTELIFDGNSLAVDEKGKVIGCGKSFEEDLVVIDLEKKEMQEIVSDSTEDLYKALVLGVRDYFHKMGFKKACFGLSGGIDSAVVANIAKDALGKENVTAVMMPSRYTSAMSLQDAKALAANIGIDYRVVPIKKLHENYQELIAPYGKTREGITDENLQARIRGMLLMALSNAEGSLLLNTSVKSEMAMGYCTLYGDMCGALCVIGDLEKKEVYELAEWINEKKEVIPKTILTRPPSAELRENQQDTDTLPERSYLDKVISSFMEEGLSIEEITKQCGASKESVQKIVKAIFHSEYKRKQAPPILRVSQKAFGIGWRFPIVQRWEMF
jgi:NAD+ synthase (glutamine-hydrolysing)